MAARSSFEYAERQEQTYRQPYRAVWRCPGPDGLLTGHGARNKTAILGSTVIPQKTKKRADGL